MFQSNFQNLILFIMVIWKLSQAYEYLENGAYLIRPNFNYQFVLMNYRYSFCKKLKIFTVGGLKRFGLRKCSTLRQFSCEFCKTEMFIHIHFCLFCTIYLFCVSGLVFAPSDSF